jgi:hypothetical protein
MSVSPVGPVSATTPPPQPPAGRSGDQNHKPTNNSQAPHTAPGTGQIVNKTV